jgi:hypothetical protein
MAGRQLVAGGSCRQITRLRLRKLRLRTCPPPPGRARSLPGRAPALGSRSVSVYSLRGRSSCAESARRCCPSAYRATVVCLRVGEPTVRSPPSPERQGRSWASRLPGRADAASMARVSRRELVRLLVPYGRHRARMRRVASAPQKRCRVWLKPPLVKARTFAGRTANTSAVPTSCRKPSSLTS